MIPGRVFIVGDDFLNLSEEKQLKYRELKQEWYRKYFRPTFQNYLCRIRTEAVNMTSASPKIPIQVTGINRLKEEIVRLESK